jgi:hypothetical protein
MKRATQPTSLKERRREREGEREREKRERERERKREELQPKGCLTVKHGADQAE